MSIHTESTTIRPADPYRPRPAAPARRFPLHLRWLGVLLVGAGLFALVRWSLLHTQNPVYVPALLLLGAAVVPAAFTTFVHEIRLPYRIQSGWLLAAAVTGGVIGAVAAGQLEMETLRELGSLPTMAIGVIEESAKLAIPLIVLLVWRRARTVDGLLLGVAVGSGFAALETMGYGLVALLQTHGDLASVTDLFLLRAVSAPGSHAAWTGLACAALFAIRGAAHPALAWLRLLVVFTAVVSLHAIWDSTATGHGYLAVGVISFALLMATTWWLHWTGRTRAVRPSGWTA